MSPLDWWVLIATLLAMLLYGLYKGGKKTSSESYLLADRKMPWYIVLMGIMATQASAITFISAPGQAYSDGMRFLQYYFGLPLAMVVISFSLIPVYRRLKVYTAYEYIEGRFDKKTRLLTAALFLISRGFSTGISIYAPAIILSSILNINIYFANILTGGMLLLYTYFGGAKAIAHTQKLQFILILTSILGAGCYILYSLPPQVNLNNTLLLAGKLGKLNIITTQFDWKDKYNIWSGLIGGFFLALSYFGTDQSQVSRYMTGKDAYNSQLGLMMNGLVKIPMQFLILMMGILILVFFTFVKSPISFNTTGLQHFERAQPLVVADLQSQYDHLSNHQTSIANAVLQQPHNEILWHQLQENKRALIMLHDSVASIMLQQHYTPDKTDTNYIFLYYVKNYLPQGIVGLIFAVIILASWGSIAAALNSLAASSTLDIQLYKTEATPKKILQLCKLHTLFWGLLSIGIAMFAAKQNSLIEAVNILGSLFYGTILGIFLVALYLPKVKGGATFYAALATEMAIIAIYNLDVVSFLWLNVIGALLVVFLSILIYYLPRKKDSSAIDV